MDCELVWVGDRATLSALSIIVTNYALDEVERKSWSFSSNSINAAVVAVAYPELSRPCSDRRNA